jgi:hypothetical protein
LKREHVKLVRENDYVAIVPYIVSCEGIHFVAVAAFHAARGGPSIPSFCLL